MTVDEVQSSSPMPRIKKLMFISIIFGLCISGYLSYLKFDKKPSVCIENGPFNCEVVLNSIYSEFAGIPIAYLGFATYLTLGLILFFENRSAFLQTYSRLMMFGIALFAWMFSMWLIYLQFFVLQALCPWCLSHETNFTILFAMISIRLWRDMQAE